jgi:PEP-CTERM motif
MKRLPVLGSVGASFGVRGSVLAYVARVACLALGLTFSGTAAFADPIRTVTTGQLFSGNDDTGFNFGGVDFQFQVTHTLAALVSCTPCTPGTPIDLSSTVAVSGWPAGRATIDGQTFNSVFFSGSLNFQAGSVIAPDGNASVLRFSPFTFTGSLAGFADASLTGTPLFSTNLVGAGASPGARALFSNEVVSTGLSLNQLDYHFDNVSATPEPASLLLLGSGAAWLAAGRRKRSTGRNAANS